MGYFATPDAYYDYDLYMSRRYGPDWDDGDDDDEAAEDWDDDDDY